MKRPVLVPLCALLLLGACASRPVEPGCMRLGRAGEFCPLPPSELPALDGRRMVTVTHDGKEDSFLGLLHVDTQVLRLAGLSLFGTPLFTLSYGGHGVVVQSEGSDLQPERTLAMLELAMADPAKLEPRLKGLTLKLGTQDGAETRDLYEDGQPIVHVRRTPGPLAGAALRIEVPPAKLTVSMQPLTGSSTP